MIVEIGDSTMPLATNPRFCGVNNPLLAPGASWTGTSGSGGTPPVADSTLRGSGWPQQAIGNFDEPPLTYITADLLITVICDTGDQDWITEVEFWLEGNAITVTEQTLSARTNAIGFACTIGYAQFVQDGDAALYAYIRPVNGYERRIGPLTVIRNGSRPTRYIDWVTGSDAADGLTTGTAWKTFLKAQSASPDSAIVTCAAGTYLEDSNSAATNSNTHPITFRRAAGLALGDVKITRTTRTEPETRWMLRAAKVEFDGIWIDMSKIPYVQNISNATAYTIFRNCNIEDANGVTGPADGYPSINDSFQGVFRAVEGQYQALLESTITNFNATGFRMLRNAELHVSGDSIVLGDYVTSRNTIVINTSTEQLDAYYMRLHEPSSVMVSSDTYDSGTDRTTIVWSDSPVLYSATDQPNQDLRVLTGLLAGSQFHLVSQTPANFTTVVAGNASALATGDTCRAMFGYHADTLQQNRQGTGAQNIENCIFQRYNIRAITSQLLFIQAGGYAGAGTVSTDGMALTCSTTHGLVVGDFVKLQDGAQISEARRVISVNSTTTATLVNAFSANQANATWIKAKAVKDFAFQLCVFALVGTGVAQSQWQDGHHHVVIRQCTHTGGALTMRNPSASSFAYSTEGCVIRDSIIEQLTSDAVPFPLAGLTVDNNHFETGTAQGTNTSLGAVTFDADYRPTAGVTRTIAAPKLRYNALGESLTVDGTDKVGAIG